ncbi:MAG: COG3014 family protein [Candidatus Krumholzibacteriia bacterium]
MPIGKKTRGELRARGVLVVFVLLGAGACTSHIAHSPFIKAALVEQDYDAALERVEKIGKGSSRLLYLYEKALILHYQERYEESNAAFDEAELVYDELYTKSISREVGALLTSDNIIKYTGENYEIAMLYYYKIFNYLYLNDPQGAIVECRKLNLLLQTFADNEDTSEANDPFLHYLTGLVYMANGEASDADVSLRVARETYAALGTRFGVQLPEHLYCDLALGAAALGDYAAANSYRDSAQCDEHDEEGGTLDLFLECGYVPYKTEENAVIPLYKDEFDDNLKKDEYASTLRHRYGQPRDKKRKLQYLMRVSLPSMIVDPFPYPDVEADVVLGGRTIQAQSQVVENLKVQATGAFDARRGGIIFKTIVRGLTKYLAKKGVEKKEGVVAGWLINALNVATETADTRSWSTLPQFVRMVRLPLPEGEHDVTVRLYDAFGGQEESFTIPNVKIMRGRTTFLNYRVY